MKKTDLKNGMIIETAKGEALIFIDNILYNEKYHIEIEYYDNNLKNTYDKGFNIAKIYKPKNRLYNIIKLLFNKNYSNSMELVYEATIESISWDKVEKNTLVEITERASLQKVLLHFSRINGNLVEFYSNGKTSYTYDLITAFHKDMYDFKIINKF